LPLVFHYATPQRTLNDIGVWETYISHTLHNRLESLHGTGVTASMFSRIRSVHTYQDDNSVMIMDYLDSGTLLACVARGSAAYLRGHGTLI
jgi:hypothetical protein